MNVLRVLLFAMLATFVSIIGSADAGIAAVGADGHSIERVAIAAQDDCCREGSERTQNCHVLPALVPATDLLDGAPVSGTDIALAHVLRLKSVDLSGPLDPPRRA